MTLTERKARLLRQIAQRPRTSMEFTNGNFSIAPHVIAAYLQWFVDEGYCTCEGARYSITDAGQELIDQPVTITPGRTVTSFGQAETYTPPMWSVRAGGNDFLNHASKGLST